MKLGWMGYKDYKKWLEKQNRAKEAHALADQVMAFEAAKQIVLEHVGMLTQGDPDKFEEAVLTVLSDQYMPGVGRIPQLILPLQVGSQQKEKRSES